MAQDEAINFGLSDPYVLGQLSERMRQSEQPQGSLMAVQREETSGVHLNSDAGNTGVTMELPREPHSPEGACPGGAESRE